ncbi:LacI family DNA-binding transcriptional regulator [Mycetocola miduiensis]|uniref:Transcriptional regulator, LacI family n=1 Tax=Mycetocola miduiensis TaxID=995034 RepID=A0A1I5DGU1_9MICO|nr:LacI family DNA-binding transcriptional regulator [Mycetocola miduiensis]SFN98327.1 transcriptional regulator, LacI family [Mycetocola miduiensis]
MSSDAVAAEPALTSRARGPRGGKSAPTIYDVARLAGVNPSTVSRALSQPGRINIKTAERIHAAAKELNYRLNPMARALPTGRTNTLGLLLADITNPMIFGIVRGAEHAAAQQGYTLVIAESQESGEIEASTAERIQPSVDGLILGTTRLSDERIQRLADSKTLVLINRDGQGVSSILPDVSPGIEEAVAYLASFGHTSIAYLSGPANSWMRATCWSALLENALSHGMSIAEIGPGVPTLDGGRAALARVLAAGVTAVVAYNDLMAIGLLRAAAEQGIEVPGRLSVIGFDDIFGSDFTSPALTTVRTPLALAGERAVSLALEILGAENAPAPGDDEAIVTSLIVRGSTGPAER